MEEVGDTTRSCAHPAVEKDELHPIRQELSACRLETAALRAELQRIDAMKTAFVSLAAHELRAPLTSIQGFVEMLLDGSAGPLEPVQNEYIQIIQGSTDRLLSITEQLVDLARIEAGRVELLLSPIDLPDMLSNVAAANRAKLKARGHHLTLTGPPPERMPLALCDGPRCAQVLGILLSNAINLTPDGGAITLSLQRAAEPGYMQIAVSDTGIGFAPEEQAGLFEPLSQAHGKLKPGWTAAGLGLHLAHKLVDAQGGRMWVESRLGVGSTFYMTLPTVDLPGTAR